MKLNVVPQIRSTLAAAALLGMATQLPADTQPGKIEVVGLKGSASAFAAGGSPAPVKVKDTYGPGTTIKTDKASSVDLSFGRIGVMRLEESGTLIIDKFTLTDTGADTVADVQLNLPEGTILGNVNKLSAASKYEIKVPRGVAGVRGTSLLASAASYFVLLSGALVYVDVPPGGNPTPYTLQAPPAVYFSPLEGVKPAPDDLVKNVNGRMPGRGGQGGPPFQPPGPPFQPPGPPDDRPPFVSPGLGGIR
jgi:FecR-like protein